MKRLTRLSGETAQSVLQAADEQPAVHDQNHVPSPALNRPDVEAEEWKIENNEQMQLYKPFGSQKTLLRLADCGVGPRPGGNP